MCQPPPTPPHCINILGGKRLPQPICFFVQMCSQFGNVIYKYCLCSQGLTLMDVWPDGWMLFPGASPTSKGGAGLGWSVASQRTAAQWGQGGTPQTPFPWAERGRNLSAQTSGCIVGDGNPETAFLSVLLGNWRLGQGQPLIPQICLLLSAATTAIVSHKTHQHFRPVLHVSACIFHYKCPWLPCRFKLGQKPLLSYSQPCLQGPE